MAHRPCFRARGGSQRAVGPRMPPESPRRGCSRPEERWGSGLLSSSGGRHGPVSLVGGTSSAGSASWASWAPLPRSELSLTRRPRSGRSGRVRSLAEKGPDPPVADTVPRLGFRRSVRGCPEGSGSHAEGPPSCGTRAAQRLKGAPEGGVPVSGTPQEQDQAACPECLPCSGGSARRFPVAGAAHTPAGAETQAPEVKRRVHGLSAVGLCAVPFPRLWHLPRRQSQAAASAAQPGEVSGVPHVRAPSAGRRPLSSSAPPRLPRTAGAPRLCCWGSVLWAEPPRCPGESRRAVATLGLGCSSSGVSGTAQCVFVVF